MLSRWPIRYKLLFGVGMLCLIVAILSITGFRGVYAYRELTKGTRARANELPYIARLTKSVSELRVNLRSRGTGDDIGSSVIPSDQFLHREEIRMNFFEVKEALRHYKEQLDRVVSTDSRISDTRQERETVAKIEGLLAEIDLIVHHGDWAFQPQQLQDELDEKLETLQQHTGELPTFMDKRMQNFANSARTQYHTWIALTWTAAILAGLMMLLLVKQFYTWIFGPLRLLIRGSRRVASGDFDHRIQLRTHDEVSELAGAMNDMTSRFQEIRDELDEQVKQRTKEVVRSEQLASVGFLAAGVAHEINNPLASIAWAAEALESRLHDIIQEDDSLPDGEHNEEIAILRKYLRKIQDEAFRCKGITDNLLDYSRMGDVEKSDANLPELVENVIDMVRHLGKYREKQIEFNCDELVRAPVNAQEIKQVVLNLVTNGLDSLDPGGKVAVGLTQSESHAELIVSDNGCGMTEDVIDHLFEPFFTRRRDGQGTGLGLSITYRIVADHGGNIEATSEGPGHGSRFRVTLPLEQHEQEHANDTKLHSLRVLFADDEGSLQELMSMELPRMGHEVTVCPDGLTAVAALERNTYDCMIVDLDMPGLNGIEVIAKAKDLAPETDAVVLTGKSSLDTAIDALRYGAFDYLTKPCKLVELQSLLQRVAQKRELTNKYRALKRQLERVEGKSDLVGNGPPMEKLRTLIDKVAPTNSTVLVLGETGTGKELVARAVHDNSARCEMPFVAINCGALPEHLIESELFGHRKGAFTGADENRTGLFEVAHGGTIFLDEIGELPKSMQAKLLRVLESGEIRPVGANEAFQIDVRVVCATHRNLVDMVEEGDFREDLMYRINTFELHIPPLRDRVDDIPELAAHLFRRFRSDGKSDDMLFSPDAIHALQAHVWPGNVRELANVIEHATILCDEPPITEEHLPRRFASRGIVGPRLSVGPMTLRELEMQAIHESLERHNGNKPAAAEELGVSLKTLYNKLNQAATLEKSA